ncbi:hypothetical protein [Hymenobacter sp. BT190]|uniref:hypothetical protein n=1 Tax=Hymenobacter sp. BT190 TaxID=2763505 RepID=UPI0016517E12|nr:hypothetical protein [Hymenobacter sp. BT190]MBC6697988.1 hypothetical protein [Hymenobacter sp. BT190]
MNFEETKNIYAFADGNVTTFKLEYEPRRFSIGLDIKKFKGKQKFEPCTIELVFSGTTELYIFEDFPTSGGYTDITFVKLDTGEFYLTLDPYGNSGVPHDEDNFVMKAETLMFVNEAGEVNEVL